jgi:hypothetical protein
LIFSYMLIYTIILHLLKGVYSSLLNETDRSV